MNKALATAFVSIVVCATSHAAAASPLTWTVTDTFYSGTFDYDATANQFSNISVMSTFLAPDPGITYTALDLSTPATATAFTFTFVSGPNQYYLDFILNSPLTNAGGGVAGSITEYVVTPCDEDDCSVPVQPLGVQLSSSSQTPAPEPVSLTLLGLGLASMGARRWRQRKTS